MSKFETLELKNISVAQDIMIDFVRDAKSYYSDLSVKWAKSSRGKRYLETLLNSDVGYLKILDESEVRGIVAGRIRFSEEMYNFCKIGVLEILYISPSARNIGIGKDVFSDFVSWAKKKDTDIVRLYAYPENKRALDFYAKQNMRQKSLILDVDVS